MNLTKRTGVIALSAFAALCVVSIAVFAARNWSNVPYITMPSSVPADLPFSIVAPDGWKTTASTDDTRDEKGARTYEWLSSAGTGGVSVAVKDVMKNGNSFEQIANGFIWTNDDVARTVAFMKDEAGDLYKDFSDKDILISAAPDTVNGAKAVRAIQQCLKPCYVEGSAATTVRYVVDGYDRVYVLEVATGTTPKTADLLNDADAVVRTFKAR